MASPADGFNTAAASQQGLNRALVFAVARGRTDKVAGLVNQGADIHWKGTRYKKSLLQVACLHGHTAVAKALLKAGADPNARDTIRRTPLFEATRANHHDITRLLLEAKADPNLRCLSSSMSPAVWPLVRGQLEITGRLLAHGLDLTAKDNEGRTPLFHTVCFRSLSTMRKLLVAGASIHDVNNLRQTPLGVCADQQLVRHMLLLIQKGAEVDARDYQGDTPLNRAARWGHLKAVKVLLRHGAHTDIANDEGVTPMQSAQKRLEDVERFPHAQKYVEDLEAAQAVLSALETAHEKNLISPFREGTNRVIPVARALRLKLKT